MTKKQLRTKIESLTDGEFIDVLDGILGITYEMTATEFIESRYKSNNKVRELIDELN